MLAIRLAEFGSTGSCEISLFHRSVEGNICFPCRLAPTPRSGTCAVATLPERARSAPSIIAGTDRRTNVHSLDERISDLLSYSDNQKEPSTPEKIHAALPYFLPPASCLLLPAFCPS